ncbi:MAG: lycopene cyclase domain-containing protein [Bacteroidota bacterium]
MENISTYFIINIFTIIIPFIFSFDKKVAFYKTWPAFFPALLITGLFFIGWDIIFTHYGVWGFNEIHLQGIHLAGLPVEEWLFFVTIPYAVVFTHQVLNVWFPMNTHSEMQRTISYALMIIMLSGTFFFYDRLYSVVVFSLSAIFILITEWFVRASWLLHFYRTFLIILFPFFIVNGILTGTWLNEPVVWYNNAMNTGIRLSTIPVEDIAYGFLLTGINISLLEWFKTRKVLGAFLPGPEKK